MSLLFPRERRTKVRQQRINEVVRECAVDKTVKTCAEGYEGHCAQFVQLGLGRVTANA